MVNMPFLNGYYAIPLISGRVCVAKPDNTLIYSYNTNSYKACAILNGRLYAINDTANPEQLIDFGPIETLGASFTAVNTWTNATVPALSAATLTGLVSTARSLVIPSAAAVDQLWPSTAVLADSLIARRGTTFATPPMKKPELMLICGTVEGSVSDANKVVNGDFSTGDTTGYTVGANATATVNGSFELEVTATTVTGRNVEQSVSVIPGLPHKVFI